MKYIFCHFCVFLSLSTYQFSEYCLVSEIGRFLHTLFIHLKSTAQLSIYRRGHVGIRYAARYAVRGTEDSWRAHVT